MKKKKISKLILKISCVALLTTVLISAMIVPSMAWQGTSAEPNLAEANWLGVNSYILAPINSFYYNYKPANSTSSTNYSVNVPNVYTSKTKSNWGGSGHVLTGTINERFGVDNRGLVYSYPWDTFASAGTSLPNSQLFSEWSYITDKTGGSYPIYPYFNTNNIASPGIAGTSVDAISYIINRPSSSNDKFELDVSFAPFITNTAIAESLITIQTTIDVINRVHFNVDYSFEYEDSEGVLQMVTNGSLYYQPNADSYREVNGNVYEVGAEGLLYEILYAERLNGTDVHFDGKLIKFNSLRIRSETSSVSSMLQCGITLASIRPFDNELFEKHLNGDDVSYYTKGYYQGIEAYTNAIWKFNFGVTQEEQFELELGRLGESIGDSVTGVFNVRIFPGVYLWHLLLIPFSLGLVFALLRYFAGG